MTSISKMKKHPIDELFHQRLEKYQMEANEDLKMRFLAQLNEQTDKRTIIPYRWYYAAAAAVCIGLAIGVAVNLPEKNGLSLSQDEKQTEISNLPPSSSNLPGNLPEESTPKEIRTGTPPPFLEVAAARPQKPVIEDHLSDESFEPQIIATPQPVMSSTDFIMDEPIPDELTLALQTAASKKELHVTPEDDTNSIFRKSAGETIIIFAQDFTAPEQVFLPELDSDSQLTLAEAEFMAEDRMYENRPVFEKFLTELRKLKHGEKVDFNVLMASNNDRFDENTLLGHEAEEFRQRLNWFRGKLSR